MSKKIIISLWILVIVLSGCNKQPENTIQENSWNNQIEQITEKKSNINNYENKQYRFKLSFPWNRTFKENIYWSTVIFFAPQTEEKATRENLGFLVYLVQSWTSLKNLYEENKKMINNIGENFQIENEEDKEIDNFPAKKITYSFNQEQNTIKQEQTLILKDNLAYIISYTATKETFKMYEKDIENIIKTIKIR